MNFLGSYKVCYSTVLATQVHGTAENRTFAVHFGCCNPDFFFFFLLLSAGVQLLYAVMWINVNQLFRVLMLCNVKRLNDVVSV